MPVSRRLRFEILRRDSHTCRYCGAAAPDVKLTVDHVIPEALGGGDEPNNLVTACHDCNAGKSSVAPDQAVVEDVDATALLFGRALERVIAQREKERLDQHEQLLEVDASWRRWTYQPSGDLVFRPDGWEASVRRFLAAGLTVAEISQNITDTMGRRLKDRPDSEWRYFCKMCWNQIGDIQEAARRLIEDGEV